MVPGSVRNWIAVNAVQQSNSTKNENKKSDNSTPKNIEKDIQTLLCPLIVQRRCPLIVQRRNTRSFRASEVGRPDGRSARHRGRRSFIVTGVHYARLFRNDARD